MPSFQFGGTQTSNIAALDTTSRSGAVFLAGMALVAANTLLNPTGRDIFAHLLIPRKNDQGQLSPVGLNLWAQVGLVLVLTLLASINNGLGVVCLAIIVAMWLSWILHTWQQWPHAIPGK